MTEVERYTAGQAAQMAEPTKADLKQKVYQARHSELDRLESYVVGHLQELDAVYHNKKDPTPSDTIAYYVAKTVCEKFRSQLHKMHQTVTSEQFYEFKEMK